MTMTQQFFQSNSRYIIGPLPYLVCQVNYYLRLCLTSQFYLFFASVSLTRYLFIFWLKNPAAFLDEFWSLFTNFCIVIFTMISHFVFYFMLGHDSIRISICTGSDPTHVKHPESVLKLKSFNRILFYVTFTVHLLIVIRIQIYKWKSSNETAKTKNIWLSKLENYSLSDMTTNILSSMSILIGAILPRLFSVENASDLNRFPNYLFEYFNSLIIPPLFLSAVFTLYFARYKKFRKTIFREFKNFLILKILSLKTMFKKAEVSFET